MFLFCYYFIEVKRLKTKAFIKYAFKAGSMSYKLVCFDLDGTIIDETVFVWQTIHEHLATDTQRRENARRRFLEKEISYEEWAQHDIMLWEEKGATKKEIMKAIELLRLMKGARETLEALRSAGLKLAIISGSLNIAVEKVLPEYEQVFSHVYLNKIHFDEHGHIDTIIPTEHDMEHKAAALLEICKKEGIRPEECVFIGDHHNDVHAARKAGLSIAFMPKDKGLEEACDVVIRKKDLRLVLPYIMRERERERTVKEREQ